MMVVRVTTMPLVTGLLLTGILLPSAALACSVPAGYDPKCPKGESFSSISCKCAAVQEAREAPAIRQRNVEEQALADEVRRKAENRVQPAAPPRPGLLTEAMTKCATDQDCQVVGGVCGNPLAVNRAAVSDVAKIIADINRRVECARGSAAARPETATCWQSRCEVAQPVLQQ